MKKLLVLSSIIISIFATNAQAMTAIPLQPQPLQSLPVQSKIILVQYAPGNCPNNFCQIVYFKNADIDGNTSYGNYWVFVPDTKLNYVPDTFTYTPDETSGYPNNDLYAHHDSEDIKFTWVGNAGAKYKPFDGMQVINYDIKK